MKLTRIANLFSGDDASTGDKTEPSVRWKRAVKLTASAATPGRVQSRTAVGVMRSDDGDERPPKDKRSDDLPISDDAYNRIPDKFKMDHKPEHDGKRRHGGGRRHDGGGNRNDGGGPPNPEPQRRSPISFIILVLALGAALTLGYQAFFSTKSTEITWTAFNRLLDDGRVETATLKGSALSGSLRSIPTLEEWTEFIPDGRRVFSLAVAQYDRSHPNTSKSYAEALEAESEKIEFRLTRPSVRSSNGKVQSDGSEEARTTLVMANKETDEIYDYAELAADASDEEIDTVKRDFASKFRLQRQVAQRWELKEVSAGRPGGRAAVQIVEKKSGKPFGKTLHNTFTCEVPAFAYADGTLDQRLRDRLSSYTSVPSADNSTWITLLSIGVTLFFFLFIFRMMRSTREQIMGGGTYGVTRSLAKKYDPDVEKRATFDDVAGMDQVKAELLEVVDYLRNPEKYERMGARVPRGTLLFGPPGTGKTLLARAVAGEAGVPFYSINGSEFIQMFVGVGASRVRDIFSTARENAPSILFIDEIDAVGRQRGAGVGGGQDEREQTLNQILSEMDGFTQTDSVMVMASTNRPDVLDPALMRPGRFDRHITVGRPSMRGRVDIFKVYLKKIPYGPDVDVDKLASQTAGFTGADIRNYVNEATLWATRNNKNSVDSSDFDFAFEKIALGLKRDEIMTPEDKRKTAVHESGHAVVGWFLPAGSKVHKVSIIPRGQALGVTWSLPEADRLSYDASEAKARLAHLLSGRTAEKLIYGETTSGVENDLQRATELARDMVARWGMSERLGPVAYPNSETHPFLGREMSTGERVYSDATAEVIDAEIKSLVQEADKMALELITSRRREFDALVDALVAEEELDRDRLIEILGPAPNDKPEDQQADNQSKTTAPSNATEVAAPQDDSNSASSSSMSSDSFVWNLPDPNDVNVDLNATEDGRNGVADEQNKE